MSPITGRFLSVDPAGGTPRRPQGWNRYSYALGSPLRFVDHNGEWPTHFNRVHQRPIDRTLSFLPKADRAILKSQQVVADRDQSTLGSFKHAMRGTGESAAGAKAKANAFVRSSLLNARAAEAVGRHSDALTHLGNAMHTLQDATSPRHRGFQEWNENWGVTDRRVLGHVAGEFSDPGPGSSLDQATRAAWDYFSGEQELPEDFFAEEPPPTLDSHGSVFGDQMRCTRAGYGNKTGNFCG